MGAFVIAVGAFGASSWRSPLCSDRLERFSVAFVIALRIDLTMFQMLALQNANLSSSNMPFCIRCVTCVFVHGYFFVLSSIYVKMSIAAILLDISGNYELAEDGMTLKVICLGNTSRIISVPGRSLLHTL